MSSSSTAQRDPKYTSSLLARAHSPTTTARIVSDKILHKPLQLLPTSSKKPTETARIINARALRQTLRKEKAFSKSRSRNKPKPLSAHQKRALCVYDTSKEEITYDIYASLHRMWCAYMRDILGIRTTKPTEDEQDRRPLGAAPANAYVTSASAGPKITSADFHGAKVTVVRSGCAGRVGVQGIVVRDTKFTFVLVTKRNQIKTVPKEGTIFRLEIPLQEELRPDGEMDAAKEASISGGRKLPPKDLVFELQGDALMNRPADRTTKKFKMHIPKDV